GGRRLGKGGFTGDSFSRQIQSRVPKPSSASVSLQISRLHAALPTESEKMTALIPENKSEAKSESPPSDPEPAGGFSFNQMLPTLVFDLAIPVIVFYVLTRYGISTLYALVVGGVSPAINNLRVWVKARRLQPLGIIVISFIAVGTITSVISGSVFFALIK